MKDEYQTITDAMFVLNGSLNKIAVALEEVLRLVKEDQERSRKYMEESKSEQKPRTTNGQDLSWPLALASGPGTKLQAASCKLQAPSCKLDKIKL